MAVPIGPMILGPFMLVFLVFVPLWFAWFFFLFRTPHSRSMHYVHAAAAMTGRTQDHPHHA